MHRRWPSRVAVLPPPLHPLPCAHHAVLTAATRLASTPAGPFPSPPSPSSSSSAQRSPITERKRQLEASAKARADNLARLRSLLNNASPETLRGVLRGSGAATPPLPDEWPSLAPHTPADSSSPRFRSTSVLRAHSASLKSSASASQVNVPTILNSAAAAVAAAAASADTDAVATRASSLSRRLAWHRQRKRVGNEERYTSPRWYGGPPGTSIHIDYFTGHGVDRWHEVFEKQFGPKEGPSAPLLRCPACAAQKLRPDAATSTTVSSADGGLWMDPGTLQRHLSTLHAGELFSAQELSLYNAQVLDELRYSCGLTPAPDGQPAAAAAAALPKGAVAGERKACAARVLLVVDSANIEIGQAAEQLQITLSPEVQRLFRSIPVAICVVHELFMPATSKLLHAWYQLARLHPGSSLHVFMAVTGIESGDLLTSTILNELLLSSPLRAVPPVLMITADGQQRDALRALRAGDISAMAIPGQVRCLNTLDAGLLCLYLSTVAECSLNIV